MKLDLACRGFCSGCIFGEKDCDKASSFYPPSSEKRGKEKGFPGEIVICLLSLKAVFPENL
jgi:hypothetical protein